MVGTVRGWAEELEAVPGRPAQRFASAELRTLTEARDEKTLTLLHRRLRRVDLLMFAPFARAEEALLFDLLSGAWREGKLI